MNMSVDVDKVCRIVEDIRMLIKDNILPRLTDIEMEVKSLRMETWPVTQALSEKSSFLDANLYKRNYLGSMDQEEAELLLKRKHKLLGYRFD